MFKTNVTCSLDADLVARLDAWRAPMGIGRSGALELLLHGLPDPKAEPEDDMLDDETDLEGPVRTDLALLGNGDVIPITPEVPTTPGTPGIRQVDEVTFLEPEVLPEPTSTPEETAPVSKKSYPRKS